MDFSKLDSSFCFTFKNILSTAVIKERGVKTLYFCANSITPIFYPSILDPIYYQWS